MCNGKAIEFCPNHYVDLIRIFFTDDSLKIKNGLELVSRPHFLYFLGQISLRDCLLPKLFINICFVFHAWAFDNVMTFEYLRS